MKNLMIVIFLFLPFISPAQYCIPSANCNDNDIIDNFTFNTISNLNSGGSNCSTNSYINTGLSTTVTKGNSYSLTVQSGPLWDEGFGIWIDYNKDNDFNDAGEFVWSSPNASTSPFTGSITIPAGASNGSTRMRVRCAYATVPAANQSCATFTYGETEDYTVFIQPNNAPPVASFLASSTLSCTGVVDFTDLSSGNPTSWIWNFGDSTTSTVKNPTHTYSSNGTYTVTLIVTNAFGTDTLIKVDYVIVSFGGGPVPPSCIAYTRSCCFGFGITNVTFNTINNSSGGASNGYEDFACQSGTSVYGGQSYNISITADSPSTHNIRVWIDFNNDAIFTDPAELIFSADNVLIATGSVYIPPTAVVNTPLRVRVAANYSMANILTPCDSIDYGQAEDYTITVLDNAMPPIAQLSSDKTNTCDGTVQFYDQSENIPVVWKWYFGDGDSSEFQNPVHTYSANGTYSVTLISANLYGSDTITLTAYVTVNIGGAPLTPSCTTFTLGYCCGYGIYNVTLSTLSNSSMDGKEGYRDFSCEYQVTVTEGKSYTISIQTGTANPQDTKAWIDFNNDSILDNASELVFTSLNTYNPSGLINIPDSTVLNTPLRLRITSDAVGNNLTPCFNPYNGQTEDYTVIIASNITPPVPFFTASDTMTCDGIIAFTDTSQNIPTSWLWNFGDGNTDTVTNPTHTYATTGNFNVTLTVCNAYGCSTLTKTNYITVASTTGGPVTASCTPVTTAYCCNMGIYNVTFGAINNSTADGIESYQDYSCSFMATIMEGMSYSISVQTGPDYEENVRAWIDFNNDGNLTPSELVFSSDGILTNHSGTIIIPAGAVKNTPLRMRISTDYFMSPEPQPCDDVTYGQVEDYSVRIIGNTSPPLTDFTSDYKTTCNGVIQFNNLTVNGTTYEWNFGDAGTSTLQNPSHTYISLGFYTVTLISCNPYGCDTVQKINYIQFIDPPVIPNCTPVTLAWTNGRGITNVTFGDINFTTNDGSDNYQDYTCDANTYLIAGQTYPIDVRTGVNDQEDVRVWIDYNNSSSFTPGELVFSSNNTLLNHSGNVTISNLSVTNLTLRMRVASDWAFAPSPQPCNNVNSGQMEDYSVIIINASPPVADFSVDYSQQCEGLISFTDSSQNVPTSWLWNFGDSTTSSLTNPSHTYTSAGTYTVTLVVTNAYGSDTASQEITIADVTIADFTLSDDSVFTGDTVYFTDNSPNADGWYWDFGDASYSSLQNPTHTYSAVGAYSVTLYAINTLNNCTSQVSKTVWVELKVDISDFGLGIADLQIQIYPNPNNGRFTIQIENSDFRIQSARGGSAFGGNSELRIINVLGQEVSKFNLRNQKSVIILDEFNRGVYFYKVTSGKLEIGAGRILLE